jgi:hypothetical protein
VLPRHDDARRLTPADPDLPFRYYRVRGRVLDITVDGAAEHIEKLALRYTGKPYASYGGPGQVRLLLRIEADKIGTTG